MRKEKNRLPIVAKLREQTFKVYLGYVHWVYDRMNTYLRKESNVPTPILSYVFIYKLQWLSINIT